MFCPGLELPGLADPRAFGLVSHFTSLLTLEEEEEVRDPALSEGETGQWLAWRKAEGFVPGQEEREGVVCAFTEPLS